MCMDSLHSFFVCVLPFHSFLSSASKYSHLLDGILGWHYNVRSRNFVTIADLFWDYFSGWANHNWWHSCVKNVLLRPFIWSFPARPVEEYSKCCCYYINHEKVKRTFMYPSNSVSQKDLDLLCLFSIAELIEARVWYRVKRTKVNH